MYKKILKSIIIFVLIFNWVFGYPPLYENFWRAGIWQNPQIPPEIQEAQASPGIQIKTVEFYIYQYSSSTDIASGLGIDGNAYSGDGASVTINLPESDITVRKAIVEWRTIIEGATISGGGMKFKRSGQTATTFAITSANTDSGESQPFIFRQDVTSQVIAGSNTYYFNAQLTNTVRLTDSAKILITYEYDDTSATQLRTLRCMVGMSEALSGVADTDSYTVNPNIAEGSVSVQNHWIEMLGVIPAGTTDLQGKVTLNSTLGSGAYIDGGNKSTFDFMILEKFANNNINLIADNSIDLYSDRDNAVGCGVKGAEWVITYTFTPGSEVNGNTVRYFVGQQSGWLTSSYVDIGAPAIYLPETGKAYRSVYVRAVLSNDADSEVKLKVSIPGESAALESNLYDLEMSGEQNGKYVILFDITSHFSSYWDSSEAVTVSASSPDTADVQSVMAELIINYTYTASSTTGIKTVFWWVGQGTVKCHTGYECMDVTFDTWLPESNETWRNSAILGDFMRVVGDTVNGNIVVDAGGVCGTGSDSQIASYVDTTEVYSTQQGVLTDDEMANMSGQTGICARVNSGGVDAIRSLIAYTTFEYPLPATVILSVEKTTSQAGNTILFKSETDQWMGTFGFKTNTGTSTMTRIDITIYGSAAHADIDNIKLYVDDDSVYNTGAEDSFGTGACSGVETQISGSTALSTTIKYIHVIFDIAAGATYNNTEGAKILINGDVVLSGGVILSGAPKELGTGTIDADMSDSSSATANSFQRKTWYDGTRYWKSFYNGSAIEFWYSIDDGVNWTQNTSATISVDTNDFSIEADSTNAFITYKEDNKIKASTATSYPSTSFTWGSTTDVFAELIYSSNEYEFNSPATDYISVAALSATQFVVGYYSLSGVNGRARVGTVHGIDGGASINISSSSFQFSGSANYISVSALSSTQFVVGYGDITNTDGKARVGTVSNTGADASIAWGAEATFNDIATTYISVSALGENATQFVVGYRDDGGDAYGHAKVGTVANTGEAATITFSTGEYLISTGGLFISVSALSATQFVVGYQTNTSNGAVRIGTVSGVDTNASISWGVADTFNSTVTTYISVSALGENATQFVVGYRDDGGDDYGHTKVVTVSGTDTITISTGEYTFNATDTTYISVSALNSTEFVVGYSNSGDSYNGYAKVGKVSGTGAAATITYSTNSFEFNDANTDYISVATLSPTQFVVGFKDDGGSDYGIAKLGTVYDAPQSYAYPSISREDTSNKIWITAVGNDTTNYLFKARQSTAGNVITGWGTTVHTLDTSTNFNKYGTIVPLTSNNMYAAWIDDTTIEGKKYTSGETKWIDGDYSYRKKITISHSAGTGAGTNYQVKLTFDDDAGSANVDLEGHCLSFPNDIRFTDDDETTELEYWIEDTNADPITVWVKVTDSLESSNQDIYIYYGKSGATDGSDAANTFIQYHGSATANYLDPLITTPDSNLYYRSRVSIAAGSHLIVWGLSNTVDGTDDGIVVESQSAVNYRKATAMDDFSMSSVSESPDLDDLGYVISEMKFLAGTSLYGYIDGDQISTNVTTNLPVGEAMGLGLIIGLGSITQTWSFIAKYASGEPGYSSVVAEQTNPWGTAADTIATGLSGMSKNMSAVSDSNGYVHLVYIDSGYDTQYRKYTGTWGNAVGLDTTGTESVPCEYVSMAIDTRDNGGIYAFWIRDNDIFYKKGCSPWASGDWETTQTLEGSGTNDWVVAGYKDFEPGHIFAEWTQGSAPPYLAEWDLFEPTVCTAADPTLTFAISGDNAITFSNLNTASPRWAGDSAGSESESSAHNLTASTNSSNGYSITVKGDTLKDGGNSITAIGDTPTSVASGGAKQFGIRITSAGNNCAGSEVTPYNGAANMYGYNATASTADEIVSCSSASGTTTYSMYYAGNIAGDTNQGDYSANLIYICTGNF
jgi:hypothetical protein